MKQRWSRDPFWVNRRGGTRCWNRTGYLYTSLRHSSEMEIDRYPPGTERGRFVVVHADCFSSLRRSLRHFRGPGRFEGLGHLLPGERRPAGRVRRPVGPQRRADGEREGVGDAVHGYASSTAPRSSLSFLYFYTW